jgi:uncharacterized DUF497 family protein
MEIEFTWDAAKAKRNLKKHRVSFEAAKQVFFDPYLIVLEDCEDDDGEVRYHAVGHMDSRAFARGRLSWIALTTGGKSSASFSAREANQYEQGTYADQFEEGN